MTTTGRGPSTIGASRILRLATVAVPSAVAISLLLLWLEEQVGTPAYWLAALALLTALEWAYLAAVAAVLAGLPTLTWLVLRRRREASRSAAARWLLAVGSLATGLALAESIARGMAPPDEPDDRRPGRRLAGRHATSNPHAMWPPVSFEEVALPEPFPDPTDELIDLVVVGESSARGCRIATGSRSAGWSPGGSRRRSPAVRVRLHEVANSGDTLEMQHQRLATLPRRPDLMIVYCGHNEFGSRINPAREVPHYDDDRDAHRLAIAARRGRGRLAVVRADPTGLGALPARGAGDRPPGPDRPPRLHAGRSDACSWPISDAAWRRSSPIRCGSGRWWS